MKVCFCLEGTIDPKPYIRIASLMVESVKRHMPNAEIIQHTDMTFPAVPGVTVVRRDLPGDHIERRWTHCAKTEGPFISLDCDVVVKRDLSGVFDRQFDVAMCRTPDRPDRAYNAGVLFVKTPAFFDEVISAYRTKTKRDEWEDSQRALTIAADGTKRIVLDMPFDEYNFTPTAPGQGAGAAIIHYRGLRKKFMSIDCGEDSEIMFQMKFETGLNTPTKTMFEQACVNLERDLPMFLECPKNDNTALIVGGGPSLAPTLPELHFHKKRGGIIFALNATHDYLIERGIVPDFHVMLDARAENAQFVANPHKGVTYLIAAQCHPDVFDAIQGYDVITWVSCMDEHEQELFGRFKHKPVMTIGGGATVGLKTMNLAYLSGFRKHHYFGFDSSYDNGKNHAYPQPLNDKESRMEVLAAGKTFTCAPWMAKQAVEFQKQMRQLTGLGVEINVHGYGLIPWICKQHMESAA